MSATMKSCWLLACGLIVLCSLGDAATTVDNSFCGVDDHYKTCCESSAVVKEASVKAAHFTVSSSSGTNSGEVGLLMTWQPVEASGHIQYEVLLTETNDGESCSDLTLMPKPCGTKFEGGFIVDDPSFVAGGISPDASYMSRIRVLSNGVPVGLSICLDREDVDSRHSIEGDTARSPKVLLPRISFIMPETEALELKRVRRQYEYESTYSDSELPESTDSDSGWPLAAEIAAGVVGFIVVVALVILFIKYPGLREPVTGIFGCLCDGNSEGE